MGNALRHVRGESQKNIVRFIEGLSGKYSRWDIWQDFIIMSAIAIANTMGGPQVKAREGIYRSRAEKYSTTPITPSASGREVRQMADADLFAPLSSLQWVDREQLKPNDYNPNKVNRENLKLLVQSIMTNGWTLPIVVRPDYTIIDGFHRWTVAGEEPLHTMLKGKVPVVIVRHDDATEDIYGTVTHNRARGTHLLEPMKAIVKRLLDEGKSVQEIGKQLGMKPEEVFRLSDFSRDDFLGMMTKGVKGYSHAELLTKL